MSPDETLDDAPLSMSDAINALAAAEAPEEVQQDQSDEEQEQEDPTAEDELPTDEEGEEDEGESESEDQAEEGEEDDEPESEQGRFVADNAKVRLDDGTVVSIAELKAGNLKNADATRKWQEAAELRRSAETHAESVKQTEQQIIEQREYMTALLQSITPQAPDPSLVRTDPVAYMEQKAQYEQFTAHLQYLTQQTQQTQQQRRQETQAQRMQKAQSEWGALLEKAPDLKDRNKFTAFESDLNAFASEYGFTPQEVAEALPYDHRMALVFKDAIEMRKLRASKPQVARKTEVRPPVQKGGKRLNPGAHKARSAQAAMERLNKSGSQRDAVAAILALEGKG